MRVVVTGATSMIGVALIKACIQNKCEILAIARKNSKNEYRIPKSDFVNVVYADLDELETISSDVNRWDVFYHLAWNCTSRRDRDNPVYQEGNIRTTLDAVKLAHRLGCRKFVGAGSQAEYGIVRDIINEQTPVSPITAYGMAKLSAGMLSSRMCEEYGMMHVWTRIFSVYGINDTENSMISYAIQTWNNGEKAKFSAGTQIWNFLYEDDAGEMLYLLGERNVDRGIYCIANSDSQRLKTYIETLSDVYGADAKYELATTQPEHQVELNVDISKTISAIEYRPKVPFENGIRKIVEAKKRREASGENEKDKCFDTLL